MHKQSSIQNNNTKFYMNPAITDYKINHCGLATAGMRAIAVSIYELYFNVRKASEHNRDFYSEIAHNHYIIFKNKQIREIKAYNNDAINKAKNILRALDLIHTVPQKGNQPDLIFLDHFHEIYESTQNDHPDHSASEHQTPSHLPSRSHNKNHSHNINKRSNTVNTKSVTQSQTHFERIDPTHYWMDSARKLGFSHQTIFQIAKFSDTYRQSAYQITKYIIEARNIIANHYHIKKDARNFESNQNIRAKLHLKLQKLFTYILNKFTKKANLKNYAGFLINSLKNFFKWCFGLRKNKLVKPKTANPFKSRRPIKEAPPKWATEKRPSKPQPTDPALCKEIRERLRRLGEI